MRLFKLVTLAYLAWALAGCTPSIGDKCQLSTDCSLRGDRVCDTSQPNGYCTVLNCLADQCPDTATCVQFDPQLPGCPYSDRNPARTGRMFCMKRCTSDSDCRTEDGYFCTDPRQAPWSAIILDDDQGQRVCIQRPQASLPESDGGVPPVCGPSGPMLPPIEAGTTDDAGMPDAGADAQADAGEDAGAADAATSGG